MPEHVCVCMCVRVVECVQCTVCNVCMCACACAFVSVQEEVSHEAIRICDSVMHASQELRIQCASAVGRLLQPPALDRDTEHSGLLSWLWLLCLPQNEKGGAFVKDSLEEWSKGRGY